MQGASQVILRIVWTIMDYELCMSPDCSIVPEEILVRVRYGLAAFENGTAIL